MAIVIQAPNEIYSLENNNNVKIFLAGGITNCPDWQKEIIEKLKDFPCLTIYNPRRENFPIDDPTAAEQQITWEFNHLRDANIVIFWFSKGSLNPIVLYELGAHGVFSDRPIFLGIDPEYERKQDVIIQTSLARPNQKICFSINEFVEEIKLFFEKINHSL
jgi:hypothetical protein